MSSAFSFSFQLDENNECDVDQGLDGDTANVNSNVDAVHPVTLSTNQDFSNLTTLSEAKQVYCPETLSLSMHWDPLHLRDSKVMFKKALVHSLHTDIDANLDIIPGRYEGGYKVWECSLDLTDYLMTHPQITLGSETIVLSGPVIELGCGHGFPGIACLQMNLLPIIFSDLNEGVLSQTTWPNIVANAANDDSVLAMKDCNYQPIKCVSGEWQALSSWLLDTKNHAPTQFRLIVTSETIYTKESCAKVFWYIRQHLHQEGVAIIASKRYYFGVGGGTLELESLVKAHNSQIRGNACDSQRGKKEDEWVCHLLKTFDDGASNVREIVLLKRKS